MRIGGQIFPAFNPYNKPTMEIYISGCLHACEDCQNQPLQDFNYGDKLEMVSFLLQLQERANLFDAIGILGGDLLCQPESEAKQFTKALRLFFTKKELWLFTGKELDQIPIWAKEYFDYIKIGCYKKELKTNGFPSSSNQKLLVQGKDY